MKNKFLISILYHSSIIFTFLCLASSAFFAVLFWSIDTNDMPSLGMNLVLLLISYIIAIIISLIIYKVKKPYILFKINFLYFFTTLFTYSLIIAHIVAVIVHNIWGLITIASILVVSIIATAIKYIPKIPYAVKATLYFFLYGIAYFGIFAYIGEHGQGNKMMILIFVYLLLYTTIVITISVIISLLKKRQSDSKKYTKLFK